MKNIIKNPIFTFIMGLFIAGSITGVAAYNYNAKQISYTPKDSNWNVNNVESAINDLKKNCTTNPSFETDEKYTQTATYGSAANLSYNISKGSYLVLATNIGSYGSNSSSAKTYTTSTLTPNIQNGSCTLIDSKLISGSGYVPYTGSWYHTYGYHQVIYKCTFTKDGSISMSKEATYDQYQTDPYLWSIKTLKLN